jgi:hypothetical protein
MSITDMQAALASSSSTSTTTSDYTDDQYTDVTIVDVAHIHLHTPLTCITSRAYTISATLTDAHGRRILITEVCVHCDIVYVLIILFLEHAC